MGDVTRGGELLPFLDLKQKFKLPNLYLFCYLQLRHAFVSQFGSTKLDLRSSALENILLDDSMKKTLSKLYKELFPISPPSVVKCREQWMVEVPDLGAEEWDDLWSVPFIHLVFARDHLIKIKFLHRIYYTPAKLSKIYMGVSAECWRCSQSPANFSHVFWHCQVVKEFRSDVGCCIMEITSIPVHLMVATCLLGLVEGLAPIRAQRTLLSLLLFYAHKALILCWKKPKMPSLSYWKGLVNSVISFYKATYLSRGCPKKFDKVWEIWLDRDLSIAE